MIALLLRLIAGLTLIFALIVGAIRSQPHDDSAIRSFFAPPQGCAAPCFMGIRPGVTAKAEALAILSANPAVINASEEGGGGLDYIEWDWKDWRSFANGFEGDFSPAQINLQNGIVTSISLWTATKGGDFFTAFGRPDQSYFTISPDFYAPSSLSDLTYQAIYFNYGIEAEVSSLCPGKKRRDLWYSTVRISWTAHPSPDYKGMVKGC